MANQDDEDLAILLHRVGLSTEAIGPPEEWKPCPAGEFQVRHAQFWRVVSEVIETEPGEYEDLPDYMTEVATEQLEANI